MTRTDEETLLRELQGLVEEHEITPHSNPAAFGRIAAYKTYEKFLKALGERASGEQTPSESNAD